METVRIKIIPMKTPAYANDNDLYYRIWDKQLVEPVGYICLQNIFFSEGVANLGYRTYDKFQNKGYMSEALGLLIENIFSYIFLEELKASVSIKNIASVKLLNRFLFFKKESKDRKKYLYSIRYGRKRGVSNGSGQ